MKMKSIIAFVMAATVYVSMAGCGSNTPSNEKKLEDKLNSMSDDELENAVLGGAEKIEGQGGAMAEAVPEVEVNPFDYLTVGYSGIAPYGKADLTTANGLPAGIKFDADKKSGLSNGDTIKVTASGTNLSETECAFIVEGLAEYLKSLDELDDAVMQKMQNQASDNFIAESAKWREGNSLHTPEFIGCYLLTAKEGITKKPYSQLYLVYKNTATVTGLKRGGDGKTEEVGDETYYTYCKYDDIVILPDGTISVDLSSAQMCDNYLESDYGYYDLIANFYYYYGYKDLDSLFNKCVTVQIGNYNYVSSVKE